MALIRCKLGYASTQVGADTYEFNRDTFGRYVAQVDDLRHQAILLSLADVYETVAETPPEAAAAPAPDPAIALKADVENAETPRVAMFKMGDEKRWYAVGPWPVLTALPLSDIAAGLPPFALIDPSDRLLLNAENGRAQYSLKGMVDDTRVYVLLDGSTIDLAAVPQIADESGQAHTQAPPAPKGLIDIKGVGPKMVEKLAAAGIATLADLVALSVEDAKALDDTIGAKGAVAREAWQAQAKTLLEG